MSDAEDDAPIISRNKRNVQRRQQKPSKEETKDETSNSEQDATKEESNAMEIDDDDKPILKKNTKPSVKKEQVSDDDDKVISIKKANKTSSTASSKLSTKKVKKEESSTADSDEDNEPITTKGRRSRKTKSSEDEDFDPDKKVKKKKKEEEIPDTDEEENKPIKTKKQAKKKQPVKKESDTKKRKRSTKQKEDNSEQSDSENKTKKKKTTEKQGQEETKPSNSKGKATKQEEEGELYKWWELEDDEEIMNKKYSKKWTTFTHNGVLFPPEYTPHGVSILYKGKPVKLGPAEEEVATMYAALRESDYYNNETFKKNFWKSWSEILGKKHKIQNLEDCDFTPIWEWHLEQKQLKKNKTKEEKKKEKEERDKLELPYKYCYMDGRREQVGNFRVEPPGLFRGRGTHPLMGTLKKRIQPEDITINIGKEKEAPKPPKGHKWKDIITNNEVAWLAMWRDTVTNDFKYVGFAAASSIKGRSDYVKFENARRVRDVIDTIREEYRKEWDSENLTYKQRSVALYFIDKLALRVGNEKSKDEADTVGCCSLRKEHVKLLPENQIEFDFLGKDSIRYHNTVTVEPKVYKNLKSFMKSKEDGDDLFDQLTTTSLNSYLKKHMSKLTAKVFRTFNASLTLERELAKNESDLKDKTEAEKLSYYNAANREVAILCNHQRAAPKTFDKQVEGMDEKIDDLKEYIEELKKASKKLKKSEFEVVKKEWDDKEEKRIKDFEEAIQVYEEELAKMEEEMKKKKTTQVTKELSKPKKPAKRSLPKNEDAINTAIEKTEKKIKDLETQKQMKVDNKTVALGTSKINYCDPRITVAWCKRNGVPIQKLFPKTLINKFPWAMSVEAEFIWDRESEENEEEEGEEDADDENEED